ncbi:50S ribosomal protein L17, partial [bacterium]
RTALYRNLSASLIRHEEIKTTQAKAKSLKPFAEKLISIARKDDLNSRRKVRRDIHDRQVFIKLFEVLVPRYKERTGGYIKLIKLGNRNSDNAPMCIVKLLQ